MHPANGVHWKLSELEALVGGFIEVARTVEGKYLVLDEEGKLKHKPLNVAATRLYQYGRRDPIVGDVVLVDTLLEMEGPEEEAEEEEE
jgi:hypothetical protein